MRSRTPVGITLGVSGLLTLALLLIGSAPAWHAQAQNTPATPEPGTEPATAPNAGGGNGNGEPAQPDGEAGEESETAAEAEPEPAPPTASLQPVGDEPSVWDAVEAQPRLRYPALSPDGRTLVFTYQSDLYRVDLTAEPLVAVPLTAHLARELRAVISPDGREVIFAAQHYGQYDLMAMPLAGGPLRRITQHEAHEYPSAVSPDGEWVLYYAWRDGSTDLFMTRRDGSGTPVRLSDTLWAGEYEAVFSPDGRHVAFCLNGSSVGFFRPGYRGYSDSEIYVAELTDGRLGNYRRITANTWHDLSPGWVPLRAANGEITPHLVFFSYGEDFNGLVACDPFAAPAGTDADEGGEEPRETAADPDTPPATRPLLASRNPEMPYRAPAYVAHPGGGFTLVAEDATGTLTRLRFDADGTLTAEEALDIRVVPLPKLTVERRVVTNSNVDEFALSPDGTKLAYLVNGEVFLTSATGETNGLSLRVTHTPARESQVSWTPDGEYLIYTTLRRGRQDLVLYDIAGRAEYWLVRTEHDDCNAVVSPKGDVVLYTRNDRELRLINLDGTNDRVFADQWLFPRQSISSRGTYAFSPKGHWVAIQATDPADLQSRIYIAAIDGSVPPTLVTAHASGAYFPQWTADEKYLTYHAMRGNGYTAFAVELVPEAPEFTEDKLEQLFPRREVPQDPSEPQEPAGDGSEPGDGEPADDDEPADDATEADDDNQEPADHGDIPIVFEGIRDRVRQIVNLPSNEWGLVRTQDGSRWLFLSNLLNGWQLWTVNHNGGGLRQVTDISGSLSFLQFTPDGRQLYLLNSGRIRRMAVNNFRLSTVPTRAEYEQDLLTERLAVYDEIGWVFARYFYDPQFAQSRWLELHERFRPLVKGEVEDDEFRSILSDLMGQLNYSHLGVGSRPGSTPGLGSTTSGNLGLRFDTEEQVRSGFLRIAEVIPGSPADGPGVELAPGLYLRAVNDRPLTPQCNLDVRLSDTTGRRVRLTVGTRPPGDADPEERVVALQPVSRTAIRELRYRQWVEQRRAWVAEWSNGEFGYLHVPRMRDDALQAFHDELAELSATHQGVIIDVRYNGGGNTAVHMLATLYRVPWLRRSFRDVGSVSENVYRDLAWERPAVTLINEGSFSNAEIFAEGFRRLGIGPVIGQPTGGGVIGTSSYRLVDGSTIRTPLAGAFTVDGEDLERNPRYPDIWVEETPQDRDLGDDPQLRRALTELRRQSLYYLAHGERPYSRGNDRQTVEQEMVQLYEAWRARQAEETQAVEREPGGDE